MRYLLIHTDDPDRSSEWDDESRAAFTSWLEDTVRAGVNLHGSRLRPPSDATTIRSRHDELLITDGPFVETKEHVAGYDVLECASLDEAVEWAGRHPSSWFGAIEVRALRPGAQAVPLPDQVEGKIRYLMLLGSEPGADPGEFGGTEAVAPWVAEMDGRGIRLYGSELEPPDSAHTVRVREKRTIVTDGPFAETKEQIGGFDVLECADLDEAIEVAGRHPLAHFGMLEVRPFWPFEGD
ncbi:MAG: YciI family protein [Acidimicrobiaceae bacterium]|nr:YciI family protein [Acidimicrobiaceae bacterium]